MASAFFAEQTLRNSCSSHPTGNWLVSQYKCSIVGEVVDITVSTNLACWNAGSVHLVKVFCSDCKESFACDALLFGHHDEPVGLTPKNDATVGGTQKIFLTENLELEFGWVWDWGIQQRSHIFTLQ